MSLAERTARAARQAIDAAVRNEYDRRKFTVERFGRHRDGYLHALVKIEGGQSAYFHCKHGSWLAPGTWNGRAVLKEPEALLGSVLGVSVKYELSELSRKFNPTPEPEPEPEEETDGDDPGSGGQAVQAAGVPDDGDRDDAPGGVRAGT